MGKRSNFKRPPADFYPTPRAAVLPLVPYLAAVASGLLPSRVLATGPGHDSVRPSYATAGKARIRGSRHRLRPATDRAAALRQTYSQVRVYSNCALRAAVISLWRVNSQLLLLVRTTMTTTIYDPDLPKTAEEIELEDIIYQLIHRLYESREDSAEQKMILR
jgi:hypothetical protein